MYEDNRLRCYLVLSIIDMPSFGMRTKMFRTVLRDAAHIHTVYTFLVKVVLNR